MTMNEQWNKDIRQKLENVRMPAPEVSWADIEKAVAGKRKQNRTRVMALWTVRAAAAAVVVATAGITIEHYHSNNNKEPIGAISKWHNATSVTDEEIINSAVKAAPDNSSGLMLAEAGAARHPKSLDDGKYSGMADGQPEYAGHAGKGQDVAAEAYTDTPAESYRQADAGGTERPAAKAAGEKNGERALKTSLPPAGAGMQALTGADTGRARLEARLTMAGGLAGHKASVPSSVMLAAANPIGTYDNQLQSNGNDTYRQQPSGQTVTDVDHRLPVRVALSLRYNINDRWSVETGLAYSYLYSEIKSGNASNTTLTEQSLNYIGLPVAVSWSVWRNNSFNIYLKGGVMMEKMVHGKAETTCRAHGCDGEYESRDIKINPLQWSASGAVGVELRLGRGFGAFMEPGAGYYFNAPDDVPTLYGDKPFNFNINLGLRYNIR